jgi:hypothetical protein
MHLRTFAIPAALLAFASAGCGASATKPAAVSAHATLSAPPADGGSYPNADAILAVLTKAGESCTAPSAENAAGLSAAFPDEKGVTSLLDCQSPGGASQDTSVSVFDTAAHLRAFAKYMLDPSTLFNPVGQVVGMNWALTTTPAYSRVAHEALGGMLESATPNGAALSPSPTPSVNKSQAAFPALMRSLGFLPGPDDPTLYDASGEAVCGGLQTQSMSAEVAYEESVDENSLTGMTTKRDILTFIRDSVEAFCPKYESELPAQ